MTRIDLYHGKIRSAQPKGPLLFLLFCIILLGGLIFFKHFYQKPIQIENPKVKPDRKVVVHLPNGHEVFTYEKYIVKKHGKTYYKGERNTIDLTGGTITYENWK